VLLAGCLLSACGRPKPPTITPEKGELTSIGPAGIQLRLELGVDNPNRVDLSARSVSGKVVLDGRYDLGTVTVSQPFQLPAGQRTRLAVPMTVALRDVPAILALAATNRSLPYDVDGDVNIGAESFNVTLPFHLSGEFSHEQLLKATLNSLPAFP
jgi:LEA14-like dessication related protein